MSEVELREYFEALIRHEREMRQQATEAAREALLLQAREYDRRLEVLNNENARVKEAQDQGVAKSVYEVDRTALAEALERVRAEEAAWRREINKQLDETRGEQKAARDAAQKTQQSSNRNLVLVGLVISALALLMRFLPLG